MLYPVDDQLEVRLRAALPEAAFPDGAAGYGEDPRGRVRGVAGLVVAPGSTDEVSAVLRLANAARVGVIPHGGGTGLVLGQVMSEGPRPLVLSLHRMARIREVSAQENLMILEAGVILDTARAAAHEEGRLFPLALASSGSAQIGGLFATNAGGLNVLRYGMARDLALGVEAVMADGAVLHGLSRLHKDNTGYDLRHLLIGSEGTLGVITAVAVKLSPLPVSRSTALLHTPSPETALALLALAEAQLTGRIEAFELMAAEGFRFLQETGLGGPQPFDPNSDWQVLIETGHPDDSAQSAMEALLEQAFAQELVLDGVIAQSETQRSALWALRETIPEANRRIGSVSSHDISLPRAALPRFIKEMPERIHALAPLRINCFGHLGDGNLHYNVFPPKGSNAAAHISVRDDVKALIHDETVKRGGSVSAEHGIGRLKAMDLKRYKDPASLTAMRQIKQALDANGILNPGAIFG